MKKLNIEKVTKSCTKNAHVKRTRNQFWKFFSLFILLFIPMKGFSQDCSDKDMSCYTITKIREETYYEYKYEIDTAYINDRLHMLDDLVDKYKIKKVTFENEFETDLYNKLKSNFGNKKALALNCINAIKSLYDASFEYNPIRTRYEHYKLVVKSKAKSKVDINVEFKDNSVWADRIPIISTPIEKIRIITEEEDYNGKYDIVQINQKGKWVKNENPKEVYKSYPVKTSYLSYASHPNYAVKKHISCYAIFDLDGKFISFAQLSAIDDILEKFKDKSLQNTYLKDFKNNKYDIQSKGRITNHYVKMILNGQIDKAREEINMIQSLFALTDLLAAYSGSFNSEYRYRAAGRNDVSGIYSIDRNKAYQEAYQGLNKDYEILTKNGKKRVTSRELLDIIDGSGYQHDCYVTAKAYVEQLKKDSTNKKDEYKIGRYKRIDDTSFYASLVNEKGEALVVFKVEYFSNKPFTLKRKITTVSAKDDTDMISYEEDLITED